MADRPVIEVEDVHKSFGDVHVLRGISFQVSEDQTVCILGASGDGKTTMLKTLMGVLPPDSGRVRILGEDVYGLAGEEREDLRRKIGVTFQSGALLNSMTLAENIALPLEYHTELDDDTIATMVKIKLQQVGLLHAANLRPNEVSGGMKKRAAVARAIAMDPKILFYDEPSAGLDPIATASLDKLINDLKTSMEITSVVVTHEMESVRRIADRVLLQYRGQVLLDGTLQELLDSPSERVQRFVRGDIESMAVSSTMLKAYHQDLLM
ncbi:MAG: ATP-binding cassette domain-containing protein [bacterium]|nr:ATP-binding cassette domain-containing protein [bacterium]